MPKWIGNAVETVFKRFIHDVTVTEVDYIHPNLKKITFHGDFTDVSFRLTQAVAFRVDDVHYRNYTPAFFDGDQGLCTIYFYLHGNGPGSRFSSRLQIGDKLKMIGPRGKSLYEPESKYHFFYGDETSIGVFNSLREIIHTRQQEYLGLLAFTEELRELPDKLDLMLDVVSTGSAEPYDNSVLYLDGLQGKLWEVWRKGTFYLTGNATAIKKVRQVLLTKGVAPDKIRAQAYWVEGKQGL